ncbi:SDR family oxidoreductase [Litoricola sp.]|nr:SDR family oxidoreductase [Litorivicinus sp.]
MNVFLTGCTGFIGTRILSACSVIHGLNMTAAVHRPFEVSLSRSVEAPSLDSQSDWSGLLAGQHVVIHAAARTHIMQDEAVEPLKEYRRVNVEGTFKLAQQAAEAGVIRFIFISSIKVNGEQTLLDQPFSADDRPCPEDAYGISKWEAEQRLWQLASHTGMSVVIIRPPLVYGPNVKGNFANLVEMITRGFPLPFGAVSNKRSLISVDNLVDLIITCIYHPRAANQVFLAGDGRDLSTTELLRGVAKVAGRPSRLIPIPTSFLEVVFLLLGKKSMAQRLLGSLQVDISKARDLLGWEPPLSVEEGLSRCFPENKNS